MKKLDKKEIINLIHKRLSGALTKTTISDAVTVITDYMLEALESNRSFSVSNFGTFSPCQFHGHRRYDLVSRTLTDAKAFQTVKFRLHANFAQLVKQKRGMFKG